MYDKMHGEGTYSNHDHSEVYKGEWKHDVQHGQGTMT